MLKIGCIFAIAMSCACGFADAAAAPPTTAPSVRVAVIGGMNDTGFWDAVAQRFEKASGIHVEVVASGPKEGITAVFKQGGVDLITMHSSDEVMNLVADGWASDPQPWVRNDMVIVGPPEDPAGIKGTSDAAAALKKIAQTKSAFVVHSSLGAQDVLRAILDVGDVSLDPDHMTVLLDDKQRRVLHIAAEKKAYTLVGRIPFRSGKIPNDGLVVLCEGDPRLRRPFVVAVAEPAKVAAAHVVEALGLAAFLRRAETQQWIATFGRGKFDDRPLFFPVVVPGEKP